MGSRRNLVFAASVAVAWAASLVLSTMLRDMAGAVLLLWPPSAIAVAALFVSPRRQWPTLLAGLAIASIAVSAWRSPDFSHAMGYLAASLIEPVMIAGLARRILSRRRLESLHLNDMVKLFLIVVAGSVTGMLISLPFRSVESLAEFNWWVLSAMLGTTIGAPILIYLHGRFASRHIKRDNYRISLGFVIAMATMFLLSWVVLDFELVSLTGIPLALLVFIASQYGQIGASFGTLMFGLAGTLHSIGGRSPAAYLSFPPFEAGIALQMMMILMMATALPLAALLLEHDRLALRLKARNARMRENLLMLNMAEEVARIGRWRYNPRTGAQDWSRQMFLINGLTPGSSRDPGDLKTLLPDGGAELFGTLAHHAKDRAPYSFEYRIKTPRGDERRLKMYATNEFAENGELAHMFAVVVDVTEHHQRQEALDKERTRAMRLAADAQYLAHTDPLTGLANRRRTITQFEKCVARCQQDGRPLAVISFDIDHFKRINDTNGHQTGDDVLVRIADIARGQARASDLIGRMGGEEFVWMLPGAGPEEASAAAERLREAIEQESSDGGLPQVTASIGYALWREGDDANSLLARVDAALYEAKEAGRNKVQQAA